MARIKTYIIVICSLATFIGCTFNNVDSDLPQRQLVFKVAVSPNTKAVTATHEYPSEVPFGVWAATKSQGCFLEDTRVVYEKGVWSTEEGHMWPEESMDLATYSPYSRGSYNVVNGVVFEDYDIMTKMPPQEVFYENDCKLE